MKANNRVKKSLIATVLVLIVVIIFYVWLDLPISAYFYFYPHPIVTEVSCVYLQGLFSPTHWLILSFLSLLFGLLSVYAKKQQTAYNLLFFAAAGIVSFFIAGIVKVVLARYRPEIFFEKEQYGFHFFSVESLFNSMPSGHAVATFAGLYAIATIVRKHWLTVLLLAVATIVAVSRVICDEHYASDVILGAYLGILSVYWLRAFFERYVSAKL